MAGVIFSACVAFLIMPTTACVREALPLRAAEGCPAMTGVTSVQILLPPGAPFRKNSYRLTDPEAVRRVVEFVNLRRDVSPATADVPSTPKLRATFYDGYHVVGVFGIGDNVFYFQCTSLSETTRGTRPASIAEIAEFRMLTTPPNQ